MAFSPEIILYHYDLSPYAQRVVWYLDLRQIPYLQCIQPVMLPRPDITAIGTNYRRIPLISIGRDIYLDTRLIFEKLEQLFPASTAHPALSVSAPSVGAIERLLSIWIIDSGFFWNAAALFPTSSPLFQDAKFIKDREEMTGRSWSTDALNQNRPNATAEMRAAFSFLENGLLADGRQWLLGMGPSLADMEAVWIFHWVRDLPGALPNDLISPAHFPKVFAWIERFDRAIVVAAQIAGRTKTLSGQDALARVRKARFDDGAAAVTVDTTDPTCLASGDVVEVWPTDSGFTHRDRGVLVGLTVTEVVIEKNGEAGPVRVHAPRRGFRVAKLDRSKL